MKRIPTFEEFLNEDIKLVPRYPRVKGEDFDYTYIHILKGERDEAMKVLNDNGIMVVRVPSFPDVMRIMKTDLPQVRTLLKAFTGRIYPSYSQNETT